MSAEARQESPESGRHPRGFVVGRYELVEELARGGLATVYLGRLRGDGGLQRTVAVKRLHAHFRTDGEIATMFLDEARLALRVRHPNVIHAVDVVLHDGELFIVMEYIDGASLSQLLRDLGKREEMVPLAIASNIITGALHGLHAAHTARDERGMPLAIVHRDVSPQNVLVGSDGHARVLDFGVAKAVNQAHVTRTNEVKGKLAYMPPEALLGTPVTASGDIFAAGIVLWEILTGYRLFFGDNDGAVVRKILEDPIPPPSSLNPAVSPDVDALVLRALERDPTRRFATAEEMAVQMESLVRPASPREVAQWVRTVSAELIESRAALVARVEEEIGPVGPLEASLDSGARLVVRPKRRRTGAIAGVLAVVALAGAGGVLAYRANRKATPEATATRIAEPPARPSGAASSPAPPESVATLGASVAPSADATGAPEPRPTSSARPAARPRSTRPAAPASASAGNQYPRW